jgi:hypothetical protein
MDGTSPSPPASVTGRLDIHGRGCRQNSSRDSHCRRAGGPENSAHCSAVTDGHGANNGRIASDDEVVTYGSSPSLLLYIHWLHN